MSRRRASWPPPAEQRTTRRGRITHAVNDSLDDFVPEQVLTMQRGRTQPMRRLMAAVLRDAVGCFQQYLLDPSQRGQRLFQEAERWIMVENDVTPLQFSDVCDLLGLEPDYVRCRLRAWQARQVARAHVGPARPQLARL